MIVINKTIKHDLRYAKVITTNDDGVFEVRLISGKKDLWPITDCHQVSENEYIDFLETKVVRLVVGAVEHLGMDRQAQWVGKKGGVSS